MLNRTNEPASNSSQFSSFFSASKDHLQVLDFLGANNQSRQVREIYLLNILSQQKGAPILLTAYATAIQSIFSYRMDTSRCNINNAIAIAVAESNMAKTSCAIKDLTTIISLAMLEEELNMELASTLHRIPSKLALAYKTRNICNSASQQLTLSNRCNQNIVIDLLSDKDRRKQDRHALVAAIFATDKGKALLAATFHQTQRDITILTSHNSTSNPVTHPTIIKLGCVARDIKAVVGSKFIATSSNNQTETVTENRARSGLK
jgi:hypothetical protein